MIHKAPLLALLLLLSACGPSTTTPGVTPTFIQDVQNGALTLCSFSPDATVIASLFANPAYAVATAMAKAVCDVMFPTKVALEKGATAPAAPTLSGVLITGHFVH